MNSYSIALFLHVVGALGFFAALALEWTSLRQIRSATTTRQIHELMPISNSARRLGIASMLTILASGIYMMATAWSGVAWIIVALGAIVLLIVLGVTITGPRIGVIKQKLTTESGSLSPDLQSSTGDLLLWTSTQTRVTIGLGIVFLMTVKPDLGGSLLAIGAAALLGLPSALLVSRREWLQEEAAK